ncbi:MAG: bifunctional folylpolyglutamate synthase/dihydrofolate synthase [Treponema sp.]|nr:bifunctional folylpolyglutamate synthase/dihydrofolate synthase [Treponema sp.]
MQTNSVSRFLEWVDSFLNFEKLPQKNIFWLDTMEYFCNELGNPQNRRTIHVAGSKGKGSVSAMLCQILESSGYKTGLYSSPHLKDFKERITRNRKFFSKKIYSKSAQELFDCVEKNRQDVEKKRAITWFELVTLYGFLCYRNAGTDWNVLEVGLGGRLDATNVCSPKVCVINSIELEHTEFLGDTEEKIAAEKGGIIKKGIPVVIAKQISAVTEVFKNVASEKEATLYLFDDYVKNLEYSLYTNKKGFPAMKVSFTSPLFEKTVKLDLKLCGTFQAENAALAAITAKIAEPSLKQKTIEKALNKVILPARFEVRSIKGTKNFLVTDGAHTVKSITGTVNTWHDFFGSQPSCLLFACAKDKDVFEIAKKFTGTFTHVILTRPGNTKACDTEKMTQAFSQAGISFTYEEDFSKAINDSVSYAKEHKMNLLVTGSFYLCALL